MHAVLSTDAANIRRQRSKSKTWKEVCKGLMTEPTWNWVFKNTFDAMEEQLNKVSIENFCWALISYILKIITDLMAP